MHRGSGSLTWFISGSGCVPICIGQPLLLHKLTYMYICNSSRRFIQSMIRSSVLHEFGVLGNEISLHYGTVVSTTKVAEVEDDSDDVCATPKKARPRGS